MQGTQVEETLPPTEQEIRDDVIQHHPTICCAACRENNRLLALAVADIAASVKKFDELAAMLDGSPAAKMLGFGG